MACEINTSDELLVTELMFNGVFNELDVDQTVALLSVLCFQEKADEPTRLKHELDGPLMKLREAAKRIAEVTTLFF